MISALLLLSVHFFDTGWVQAVPNSHNPLYMHGNWTECVLPGVPSNTVVVELTATYERATTLVFDNPYPYVLDRGNFASGWGSIYTTSPGAIYGSIGGPGMFKFEWDFPLNVQPYSTLEIPYDWMWGQPYTYMLTYGEDPTTCQFGIELSYLENDGTLLWAPFTVAYVDSLAWLMPDGRRWITYQAENVPLFTVRNFTRATGFARYLDAQGVEL